ncbi:hypothetical protein [Modestobacter muralis]|nr:hypothetical protein [Modestobacter muralis]
MTPDRLVAAQAMRAQGMTLIEIAATLCVGRSSLVRALMQTTDGAPVPPGIGANPEQSARELAKPGSRRTEPTPEATSPADLPAIQLLGRAMHRRREDLEALTWSIGHSPTSPVCADPTTGLEEQYARVDGQRKPVVVTLAQPCGYLVDEHVAAL